ncbi:MAG: hypothetical protein V9G16_02825 [Nitrosomonas sp.]
MCPFRGGNSNSSSRATGSHVPHKSLDRTLATSMPDADRAPPGLILQ